MRNVGTFIRAHIQQFLTKIILIILIVWDTVLLHMSPTMSGPDERKPFDLCHSMGYLIINIQPLQSEEIEKHG